MYSIISTSSFSTRFVFFSHLFLVFLFLDWFNCFLFGSYFPCRNRSVFFCVFIFLVFYVLYFTVVAAAVVGFFVTVNMKTQEKLILIFFIKTFLVFYFFRCDCVYRTVCGEHYLRHGLFLFALSHLKYDERFHIANALSTKNSPSTAVNSTRC